MNNRYRKLDKMDYVDFINYLEKRRIEYSEDQYIDFCKGAEEVIAVLPANKKFNERYFSTDGGWQMFDDIDYYKLL